MYRTFVRRPNLESSEYEILPKEMILQETPVQKLRRLMYEVKELGQEAELNEKVHDFYQCSCVLNGGEGKETTCQGQILGQWS